MLIKKSFTNLSIGILSFFGMYRLLIIFILSVFSLSVLGNSIKEKNNGEESKDSINKKDVRYQKKYNKERGKHTKWMRKNRRDYLHSDIHKRAY